MPRTPSPSPLLLLLLAVAAAAAAAAAAAVDPAATTNILFVGNSFTFVNDLPGMVTNISASLGRAVHTDLSAIGGCTLYHQRPSVDATTAGFINGTTKYDFVVLQTYSELPTVKAARSTYLQPAVQDFVAALAVHQPQAKIVLYQTWGYNEGVTVPCPTSDNPVCFPKGSLAQLTQPPCNSSPDYEHKCGTFPCMSYALARGYLDTLAMSGVDRLAPCGITWMVVRGSAPVAADCKTAIDQEYSTPLPANLSLPLNVPHTDTSGVQMYRYNGKDKHPSVAGQYLNGLVFTLTFFDGIDVSSAWVPADIDITADQAKGLKEAAAGVVNNYKSFWHHH